MSTSTGWFVRSLAGLLLAGCTAGGGFPQPQPTPESSCDELGPGYAPASHSDLDFTILVVNGLGVVPDITTSVGCVDVDNQAAAWWFRAEGRPFGLIEMTAPAGAQPLPSPDLTVDLFGHSPPILFEGAHFGQGAWVVNSVSPTYATALQDVVAATPSGHTLTIGLTATASP